MATRMQHRPLTPDPCLSKFLAQRWQHFLAQQFNAPHRLLVRQRAILGLKEEVANSQTLNNLLEPLGYSLRRPHDKTSCLCQFINAHVEYRFAPLPSCSFLQKRAASPGGHPCRNVIVERAFYRFLHAPEEVLVRLARLGLGVRNKAAKHITEIL